MENDGEIAELKFFLFCNLDFNLRTENVYM